MKKVPWYHFLFHEWNKDKYKMEEGEIRICLKCNKKQILIEFDPGGGFEGPIWVFKTIN